MNSQFIKVYSHPRSGTHLLEAFIAENFYSQADLSVSEVIWGHWSNRQIRDNPNLYGKLFGSHIFPSAIKAIDHPGIYIYRDPRSVAYSIWKTPNFIHPKLNDITFHDFLRTKIDWIGSPAFKCRKKYTIIRHWEKHVLGWLKLADNFSDLMVVQYEELISNPEKIVFEISQKYHLDYPDNLVKIDSPVGLLPNKAISDSWKDIFTDKDLKYVQKKIRSKYLKSIYF